MTHKVCIITALISRYLLTQCIRTFSILGCLSGLILTEKCPAQLATLYDINIGLAFFREMEFSGYSCIFRKLCHSSEDVDTQLTSPATHLQHTKCQQARF